ncbi:Tetratricopeptide repeat-containing protein [Solimonas aquatica]|uniref:Tetratricopeptide repeat-containing protein n=1 Tax=Solimonas aquatica TaxID=489703 RepID=A0A1H9L7D2_9GAMM|nr:sulfotransferase [Solimonas aquatica]SER07218.1 Tetratricopeptide repeat-containing protein [Solimonas aquatica]
MTDPKQLAQQAFAALRRGDLLQAERLAQPAYRAAPREPLALHAYAAVLHARGSYVDAARVFQRLVDLLPAESAHWMNLATAQRDAGDPEAALHSYRQAYQRGERSADFFFNAGLLLADRKELDAAREHLREAARRAPQDAEIGYQYARVCFACVEVDETQAALRAWRGWQNWTPQLLAGTAGLLLQMGEQADAEVLIAHLDALPERSLERELQIIGMLERLNRVDEAQRRFAALPEPEPAQQVRCLMVAAQLAARAGRHDEAAAHYEALLQLPVAEEDRQQFLFPLAKALDARGRYAEAMHTAKAAHESQWQAMASLMRNRIDEQRPIMAITAYGCEAQDVWQWQEPDAPDTAHSPIFIVAFPRSGTTLLEQALDAHPQLQTMDEQPFLQKAVLRFETHGLSYPDALAQATPDQLADIRRYYWELVSSKLQLRPGQRLIDKNPLNMLRLPAIVRLFPNAPILLAVRHPCDVIISNFFQHYRAPEFVRLCRDLPSLVLAYRKAFDYWYEQAAILQPRVLEVRYESFVADFDRQLRAVADFLELPWDEAMLRPADHARAKGFISTPSYSQVVQPVNTKAVGRWRRYEADMLPLLGELQAHLQRWRYLDEPAAQNSR